MHNVLIISAFVPYDNVDHAGGKVHNYYLKELNKLNNIKIKLISFATEKELKQLDLEDYNIDNIIIKYKDDKLSRLLRMMINIPRKLNYFSKYYNGFVSKYKEIKILNILSKLKRTGYYPEIIILEWTQMVLLSSRIKKIYPYSKLVAIEHDVSFLRIERLVKNRRNKLIANLQYKKFKKNELDSLSNCRLVLTLNVKDMSLLKSEIKSNIKIDYICPYYMIPKCIMSEKDEKYNIVFYGAMWRKENYESCIWFIENVFYKLLECNKNYKFTIVGSNPNDKLKKYESENIILTGFVDEPLQYLKRAMCVVAPLLNGAGIKIKVLEAMASGCVVITNKLGIEGIPAQNMKDYIHCEEPEEYISTINNIANKNIDITPIRKSAKKNMEENFSKESSLKKYINYLEEIVNE